MIRPDRNRLFQVPADFVGELVRLYINTGTLGCDNRVREEDWIVRDAG